MKVNYSLFNNSFLLLRYKRFNDKYIYKRRKYTNLDKDIISWVSGG